MKRPMNPTFSAVVVLVALTLFCLGVKFVIESQPKEIDTNQRPYRSGPQ